jgi:hypothetical protein
VTQAGHGRVEVQDLEDEQVDGLDRPQLPLAPAVPRLPARPLDVLIGQEPAQFRLDAQQRR